jgi:predicted dithiol-disulfide oxidoreductase (DUF899 family)
MGVGHREIAREREGSHACARGTRRRAAPLADLFEGRRQLLLYHFMFGPNQEVGCDGRSMVLDQICHLAHLHARDTSFAARALTDPAHGMERDVSAIGC